MPRKQPAVSPVYRLDEIPEYPPEGVVLGVAGGVASVLPRSLQNLAPDAKQAAGRLQLLANHREDIEEQIDHAVAVARCLGVSWPAIGWCLGVTGEGARKAFS